MKQVKEGNQTTTSEEQKMIQKVESFVSFSDACEIDWTSPKYDKRLRRTTPTFFLIQGSY